MENWGIVNEQIERSNIFRMPWKKILGRSLTEYILKLKFKGHTSEETMKIMLNHPKIKEMQGRLREIAIKNIRISVAARYGENNTANKLKEKLK